MTSIDLWRSSAFIWPHLANYVRVVGVGNVHLHGDAVALRLEVLQDPRLGQLHAELGPTHADVRIFTEARRRKERQEENYSTYHHTWLQGDPPN